VITQSQLTQYLSTAQYQVPVVPGQAAGPQQVTPREVGGYRHQQQVIEMSINESDEDRPSSEEEEKFPSTRIEKVSNSSSNREVEQLPPAERSELSVLKSKLLEMRERHASGLLAEEPRGRQLAQAEREPDRSPEDYFAKQHMLGASIGIARQGEPHLASQQTFPAKEPSLIHQQYPFGSSASFTAHDVSHMTQQPAHTSFRKQDERKASAPHLQSSQEDFKTAGFVKPALDKKRLFAQDDDDDYEY